MTPAYHDFIWRTERELSLWDILIETGKTGNSLTVGDRRLSYVELAERANRLAGGLYRAGIRRGDRIAFVMSDRIEIAELVFAAVRMGAIIVPINPYLKGNFLRHPLELSDPSILIVDRPGFESIRNLIENLTLIGIFAVEPVDPGACAVPIRPFEELYDAPFPDELFDPDGKIPMALMFTSGTTGPSKGCVLTRGYQVKLGSVLAKGYGLTQNDVIFSALPMFHAAALTACFMEGVVSGASVHLTGVFHASTFIAEAGEAGATMALCIGAMGPMLLGQPPRETDKQHSLRLLHLVPMSLATQEEFYQRFNVRPWTESFGQTECMMVAFGSRDGPNKPTSCGRATEVLELAILDDDGNRLPPGRGGEIAVRPKTSGVTFAGYWRNPEATLERWSDLWHRTGDNGMLDDEGFLYFLDRKKDAIRRRGENVSSIELEGAISQHPAVKMVAVHAVESDMSEDEIKACLLLHDGHSITPAEIFGFFRDNLPYFAIPRFVECFAEFPMTESMKVKKDVLRASGSSDACWDLASLGFRIERSERRNASAC